MALAAISALGGEAYAAQIKRKIKDDTGRSVSPGRLHDALAKFVDLDWLKKSERQEIKARGTKRVQVYVLTEEGEANYKNAATAKRRVSMIRG